MKGGGKCVLHAKDEARLSSLIDLLNSRVGTELTDSDQRWFEQQVEGAAADPDVETATCNTEENFGYAFDQQLARLLIARQFANDSLFRMSFDKPEFQEALTAWARKETYRKIQDGLGGAA